jgi:ADP-heptose:LPS heptosyltransferase
MTVRKLFVFSASSSSRKVIRCKDNLVDTTFDRSPIVKTSSQTQAPGPILVTRFKSIGDILFTLPAVHVLRENFPDRKISFLTSKEFGPMLGGFRDVDEVLTIDRLVFRRGNPFVIAREMFSLTRLLRRGKFSLAVDFQGYGETALITRLTGAPRRWGTVYHSLRGLAYTRGIKRDPGIHPAEGNLLMLQECGLAIKSVRNVYVVPDAALAEARALFTQLALDAERPILFVQPFTSSPQKNWPLENYLALATHWRDAGIQVLFGGGPRDRPLLEPVSRAGFPISAGASLLVSAGLVKLSSVIVGGDTGLIHLAVAMEKRAVFLAGFSRRPKKFYPFRHEDWKISPPAGLGISAIPVTTVVEECRRAFAEVEVCG